MTARAPTGEARNTTIHHTEEPVDGLDIKFIGIDPETPGGNCPAAFVDEKTGDLLIQGWTVTDPAELAMMAEHSPLLPHETIVRVPARMADIIRKACDDSARAAV